MKYGAWFSKLSLGLLISGLGWTQPAIAQGSEQSLSEDQASAEILIEDETQVDRVELGEESETELDLLTLDELEIVGADAGEPDAATELRSADLALLSEDASAVNVEDEPSEFILFEDSLTADELLVPATTVLDEPVAEEVDPAALDVSSDAETSELGQVTSVTQLSDVQPTDWAYQALQSLVERYGCIVGYPDSTFRGSQALTRYEFAAGLNACLDRINEIIATGLADVATREDLLILQRLQEEFAAELALVRGKVGELEARVDELEANQFSTTTRLTGSIWFNLTQAFPSGDILAERNPNVPDSPFAPPIRDANNRPSRVERNDPQVTFSHLTWLNFITSFSGQDSLVVQLAVGNGNSPANTLVSAGYYNSWGTPFLDQTGAPTADTVAIRELFYSFPVGDDLQISVGPRLNYYRYFDGNRYTFFLTGATSFNSNGSTLLNAVDRGSGAVVQWQIVDPVRFTVGYLAENTEFLNGDIFNTAPNPNDGLFNSTNTITAQLEVSPTPDLNFRFIYNRSSLKAYNGFIGSAVGEPLPYGYADDGFGGTVRDSGADAFVFNFDWQIADWIGIFGRYSYGRLDINPTNANRDEGEIRVQSFQAGLGFPDLFKEGALGVISFLVPQDYLEGRRFLLSGAGDGGTQYELELSYRYPVNNNIAIVPAFYTIWNANNFESNPTVYVGNVRMQFTF